MTHTTVEDIREQLADIIGVWPLIDGDKVIYGDRVEKVCNLLSTLLDGLVLEEQPYIPDGESNAYIRNLRQNDKNVIIREHNQRVLAIKESLKGKV